MSHNYLLETICCWLAQFLSTTSRYKLVVVLLGVHRSREIKSNRIQLVTIPGSNTDAESFRSSGNADPRKDGATNTTKRYLSEFRERAVRLVTAGQHDSQSEWPEILSVSEKLGCNRETLRR